MKQIKKLNEVSLNPGEMRNVTGGASCACEYGTMGTGVLSIPKPTLPPAPPPTPHCGCGCANCIMEDGGTGFMLGMNWNNMSVPTQAVNNNAASTTAISTAYNTRN